MVKRTITTRTAHIRHVCRIFVESLAAFNEETILREDIFVIMDKEAQTKGYRLCARQGGIHGTHVYFEKLDVPC